MKKIFIILFLMDLFLHSPAKASEDETYTFIKVTCNLKSKTATIRNIYTDEGDIADYLGHQKDGVYHLNDISPTGTTRDLSYKQSIKFCDFGSGQTLAFAAQTTE